LRLDAVCGFVEAPITNKTRLQVVPFMQVLHIRLPARELIHHHIQLSELLNVFSVFAFGNFAHAIATNEQNEGCAIGIYALPN